MSKIHLQRRQVDLLFLGAGILIFISYLFLFQRPCLVKYQNLRAKKRKLNERIASFQTLKEKANQISQEKIALVKEIKGLETHFTHSNSVWNIMQKISRLANELGLDLRLMQPKVEEGMETVQHHTLSLVLEGDFPTIYRFIYRLEKNMPTLQAKSLQIRAQSSENLRLTGEFSFDLFIPPPTQFSGQEDLKK